MKIVCIIPARGGSKGIPGKNIANFCGKPLLAHSIEQAKASKFIDLIFVSSDDYQIMGVAGTYGAIPVPRPVDISGDEANSESALIHVLNSLDVIPDLVVFLQATSPLRTTQDIDNAIQKLLDNNLDSVFSASPLEDCLIWEEVDGKLQSFNYDWKNRKRRQDHKPQYVENGSIYVMEPEVLLAGNRLGGKIGMSLMESWKMHEIDDLAGMKLCEYLYKENLL